jgi:hypothetical protein
VSDELSREIDRIMGRRSVGRAVVAYAIVTVVSAGIGVLLTWWGSKIPITDGPPTLGQWVACTALFTVIGVGLYAGWRYNR